MGDFCGAGEDVGASSGDAELAKLRDAEVVGEALHQSWPIVEVAIRNEGGFPHSGSIHGDEAELSLYCKMVGEACLEARGRPAVVVEDWVALRVAVFVPG